MTRTRMQITWFENVSLTLLFNLRSSIILCQQANVKIGKLGVGGNI